MKNTGVEVQKISKDIRSCLNFFQKYYLHCPQEVLVFLCHLLHEPTLTLQSK